MNLESLIIDNFRLLPAQKDALKKLGLKTIKDLLYHFPTHYGDTASIKNIEDLKSGEEAVIYGQITGLKTGKAFVKKTPIAEGSIEDESGRIKVLWFHQPYIAKMIHEGAYVRAQGKVSDRKGALGMINPKIEIVTKIPIGVGHSLFGAEGEKHSLYPVYPESRGITSNWFYHALLRVFSAGILKDLIDPLPKEILDKYNLPSLNSALIWIHSPQKEKDTLSARKRFAFEEVFLIQLEKQKNKIAWQKNPSFVVKPDLKGLIDFTARFPFTPTEAQKKAIDTIMADFQKGYAMNRLLEGDVGSGKTAVAAATIFAITNTNPDGKDYGHLQTTYMCPTEILAKQHFESFIKYFTHLNISIGLITSSGCQKFPSKVNPHEATDISRAQLLKWVANGEIPILIGTHSLIQKTVKFKNLAYVIIDEQHRFGTLQRQKLTRKDKINPHLLSMTATPIPRTLTLTIYGDLDLTLLDQMPSGRKPIITEIVLPTEREKTYEAIRAEIKAGRQAYVICPRIDEPDPSKEMAVQAKSVTEEARRLKKDIFPEYEIAILHSKMTPDEKEAVMDDFKDGRTQILVATSVVEVGVNVPNATMIIIEGAERFGLAQLHQLRGRVIRSNHQAYCYVFAESKSQKTKQRLSAIRKAKDGFELSEYDLQFRGPGELSGNKQWGLSDIGMEALKNLKMVEAARAESLRLLSEDENLTNYPTIKKILASRQEKEIHFE